MIKGDLLKTDCRIIAHGVNTLGVMGAGVARALANKYPNLERQYREFIENEVNTWVPNRNFLLGLVNYTRFDDKIICNVFIQNDVGRDGKKYGRYSAIARGLYDVASFVHRAAKIKRVAIPKIGCGLAGLDWNIVKEILLELEEQFDMEFEVYYL